MIRFARKEDLPDILNIYNDAIINTTAIYTYDPKELEERVQWFEAKAADEPIWVYVKDNHIVGYATYGSFRDWLRTFIRLNILYM